MAKRIRAGELNTPVMLGNPVVVKDATGAETITWNETQAWAKIEQLTGREWLGNAIIKDNVDARITLRFDPNRVPSARWRVRDANANVLYDIQAVVFAPRIGSLECFARTTIGSADAR